jgi:hypothetical protein
MRNPFEGVPFDEARRRILEEGKRQAASFDETTRRVLSLIEATDRLDLLANLAAYGLPATLSQDGDIQRMLPSVMPAHVEMAQAICLRDTFVHREDVGPLAKVTSMMFDALKEWSEQFHLKRLLQYEGEPSELEARQVEVREVIRTSTQNIRNWGYHHQIIRVARELSAPLDPRLQQVFGFTGADAVAIFDFMYGNSHARMNDHYARLKRVLPKSTIQDVLTQYQHEFPDISVEVEAMKEEMRLRKSTLRDVKRIVLMHSDLGLYKLFVQSPEEIAAGTKIAAAVVERVLTRFGLRFGDLRDSNVEHFFMSNPIWTRPVIVMDGGHYFCPMPQLFLSYFFESLLSLVRDDDALRTAYDNQRSQYLEASVAQIFRRAFPDAAVISNFKWRTPDRSRQFENDLLAKVDSFLFIVECKSGRVSPSARRGADESLSTVIDDLLVEPSRQSERLERTILEATAGGAGTEEFVREFPFELSSIRRIVRLSVTLEDISFLQSRVNGLKAAGYVPEELNAAPCVTVSDLETVFEILREVPERVHYWIRRSEWEGRADYFADELDLLGVYLKTCLDLGDLEFGSARLMFVGESTPIDNYFEATRHGVATSPPSLRMTKRWRDMLNRLSQERPQRWTEAAVALLCTGAAQQDEVLSQLGQMVVDVKRRRERAHARNVLIFVPAMGRREAIAFACLMHEEIPNRSELMERAAMHAFDRHAAILECVVLALDVDQPIYPYATLGVYGRPVAQ